MSFRKILIGFALLVLLVAPAASATETVRPEGMLQAWIGWLWSSWFSDSESPDASDLIEPGGFTEGGLLIEPGGRPSEGGHLILPGGSPEGAPLPGPGTGFSEGGNIIEPGG